ncbi:MAG TPA: isocitrate lyase/PEP mutase family protein [Pseudonocardiaceae bacterium]|nr:isocitrate lyase/PEP mutase family protein [Pseudonocardiaceae bacterium]
MSAIRRILSAPGCQVLPGCYDRISAALVQAAGFPAAVLSGASIQGSFAGFSDEPELADFAAAVRHVSAATSLPLVVDGEDGFGAPADAVCELLDAGAAAVHVEDYVPARGGLVDPVDFARTIGAIGDAVGDRDGMLLVRTDGVRRSPDEAIDRAKRYADCAATGAVLPFLGTLLERKPELLAFLERLVAAVAVPVVAYAPLGHELSAAECEKVGVRALLVPHLVLGSATAAVRRALDVVRDADAARRFAAEQDTWSLPRLKELF